VSAALASLGAAAARVATVPPPAGARFTLFVIIASAVVLTAGWYLAATRRYTAHALVQTGAVVAVSLVAVRMVASLVRNVLPEIPSHLGQTTYAVDTVHAVIGAVAAVFGVYVVLAAGRILPPSLRFRVFRPFMRTAYGLYLGAAVAGVVLYVTAYGVGLR
jgi:hypothetical protein